MGKCKLPATINFYYIKLEHIQLFAFQLTYYQILQILIDYWKDIKKAFQ